MTGPRMAALVAALLTLALPAGASAAVAFGPAKQIPHGDPKQHPYWSGGEPSIAFDPNGDGHVYITAPQFIPTIVDSTLGVGPDADAGIAFWGSDDAGRTWPKTTITGAANGGGDTDVEVLADHTVLAADLEAAATDICTSHDFGKTFEDCDGGLATNQQGPENDREWLTRGTKPGEVYLTYHDFTGGFPIIERSDDGGQTFTPCGTIIDPTGPAAANYTPSGGTLVSKPVVNKNGDLFVEFAEPDGTADPTNAPLDHMYIAIAKGGCTGQTVFKNVVIYENPDADVANIFQTDAIDAGGELYVFIGGHLSKADADRANAYLFTSTDDGEHWRHVQVNSNELGANVLPAIAGGQAKGEAVLGWFGSTSKDPNDTKAQWRYYAAATYDGGQTFTQTTVTPDVIHYGDICTSGLLCGLIPGEPSNRNLADFSSAAIDPKTGCAALAIPGDPYNRPDQADGDDNADSSVYVSLQQDQGDCLVKSNAGKAASTVGSSSPSTSTSTSGGGTVKGCTDRVAPRMRFHRVTRSHRRVVGLSGITHDRGCGAKGKGKVKKIRLVIGRKTGKRYRFLHANGRLGKATTRRHAPLLKVRGKAHWRFKLPKRTPAGRYTAWLKMTDAAGNTRFCRPPQIFTVK